MSGIINEAALDRLFRTSRSIHAFTAEPVSDATLKALYDLLKWGPNAFNAQPARYLFLRSAAAKARLKPFLAPANADKTLAAPVTAIVAYDLDFAERLPELFPAYAAKALFEANPGLVEPTAVRSGTLQGAYLLLAARALGLDVGPMSGFDAAGVDREFFPDGKYRSNFLVNLGYGDYSQVHQRGPRLAFADVAAIL